MKIYKTGLIVSLMFSFVLLVSPVLASTIQGKNWYNEASGVHKMQIWVDNPEVSIKKVKFNKHTIDGWNWTFTDESKRSIIFSGPRTQGAQEVIPTIFFSAPKKNTDFAVEWAELIQGDPLTGTNYYKNKRWSYTKGSISNTPTPIPGAFLIFGGGLGLLAWFRKKIT